jgi:hypothetical protein
MEITTFKGLTKNPATGGVQHGTVWYTGPF